METETKEGMSDVDLAIQSENNQDDNRTDQGPDIDLKEPDKKDGDQKSDDGGKEVKDTVDPTEVLKSLEKDDGQEDTKSKGHNFDKGLQKVQAQAAKTSRDLEAIKAENVQVKELLQKLVNQKTPTSDDLDILANISDDDLTDGKALKQGLNDVHKRLQKQIDERTKELKRLQEETAKQLKAKNEVEQTNLSPEEVVQTVRQMYSDLDPKYAEYIVQQADPEMRQFDRDFPDATKRERQIAARGFLNDQANKIRVAIADARSRSSDSTNSESNKAESSTKIVDPSASSATTVKTGDRPILSPNDAREKWLSGVE